MRDEWEGGGRLVVSVQAVGFSKEYAKLTVVRNV